MRQTGKWLMAVGFSSVAATLWMTSRAPAAQPDAEQERLKTFAQILELVETHYVEEVSSEKLMEGAIRGMLRTLDPHSNYLDTRSYKEMREEQRGSFYSDRFELILPKPLMEPGLHWLYGLTRESSGTLIVVWRSQVALPELTLDPSPRLSRQ